VKKKKKVISELCGPNLITFEVYELMGDSSQGKHRANVTFDLITANTCHWQ